MPTGPNAEAEGRGREGVFGEGRLAPFPPARSQGSTVSSFSGVWGGAPEEKCFCSILTAMHGLW